MRDGTAPAFAGHPGRRWAPLALTLGLHLLLALAWLTASPAGPVRETAERASTFVFVQLPAASRPKPPLVPAPARPRAALPIQSPPKPVRTTEPADAAPSEPAEAAPAEAAPAEAPADAGPGDLLATSKRMAGGVDRVLRNGSSPITAEPERKWERFAEAFAAARTSVSRDTVLESYTAADGVIVYRKTVGHRVACYRSGSVGGIGPADGRSAGTVNCPIGVRWSRH